MFFHKYKKYILLTLDDQKLSINRIWNEIFRSTLSLPVNIIGFVPVFYFENTWKNIKKWLFLNTFLVNKWIQNWYSSRLDNHPVCFTNIDWLNWSFIYFVDHQSLPYMFALRFWQLTVEKIWRYWRSRLTFLMEWRMSSVGGASKTGLFIDFYRIFFFSFLKCYIEIYMYW